MEAVPVLVPSFVATTLGFLVFLIGAAATRKLRILRDFNIPEPVSGGLIAAAITLGIFIFFGKAIEFDLQVRDYFLVVFFAAIGLNARLADLLSGGKPLLILLVLTLVFIILQNVVGVGVAASFGMPPELGVLMGSASLIGGHGTAIAWSPQVAEQTGFGSAPELGIAAATIGLVLAALIGGPIAKFLIEKNSLHPDRPEEDSTIGLSFEEQDHVSIEPADIMRSMFVLHFVIILGWALHSVILTAGLKLPLFVPCLLMGIAIGNLLPVLAPKAPAVSRSPALALISEFTLGTFLAMSLMALQLWTLSGMGLLLVVGMGLQTAMATLFILLVVFPLMGRGYRAAVLSAGFGGFALGATPTAIANMTAVTKRYGPSPIAFVILPLVSAFFVDLANAVVIQTILAF